MAWRPYDNLIAGELDNTVPGKVTGWLRFLGMEEQVGLGLTHEQEVAITGVACEAIREKDPEATITVNVCNSFGDYAADPKVHLGPIYDRVFTPLAYLEEVAAADVDFDVVGVQLYFPARDMLAIGKILEEYTRFGKPVHITELGIATGGRPASSPEQAERINRIEGLWHPPWSEKVQADWAEWFLSLIHISEPTRPY